VVGNLELPEQAVNVQLHVCDSNGKFSLEGRLASLLEVCSKDYKIVAEVVSGVASVLEEEVLLRWALKIFVE